jgi:DDE superfamily endonuclease
MKAGSGAGDLDVWLTPFLAVLGRKTRRTWARLAEGSVRRSRMEGQGEGPLYPRGLLGPGERKSLQPMAARLGLSGHDQLQHFIASPAWDDAPLWRVLAVEADRLVGGPDAVLVIDDTALPKQGAMSVGVARRYCGVLGKRANCQALVSLTLARDEVPIPVALRLFLPETWTQDPGRCAHAGVPEAAIIARSKGEIALAELDRLIAAEVRFGVVLADAGYGASAAFRRGLSERGLTWAVGIPRNQKVYGPDVQLIPPTGRKRRPMPDEEPREAEAVLAESPWRRIVWRRGTKGALAPSAGIPPAARVEPWPAPPGSRPPASVWAMVRPLPTIATCPAKRRGWLASGAAAASANTISAIYRPGRPCAPSPPRSRRAGCASRRTSSSSRSSASATSRGAHGPDCTGMR